ncbi:DNA mismatch repair ATPase msh1 [Coelomomyces lativittatus]|nr:DNA mismatch repair ATPase msh1 [Coelomomyces lativittatus]
MFFSNHSKSLLFFKLKLHSLCCFQPNLSRGHGFYKAHFRKINTEFGKLPTMQLVHFYKSYAKDLILFVKMGSFYEIYGNQAAKWAPILNLKLGPKGYCGFPDSALLNYVENLVCNHKQRVAVINQAAGNETAEQRQTLVPFLTHYGKPTPKGMHRYLSRIYSPGTFVRENKEELIYLASMFIHCAKKEYISLTDLVSITFCDIASYETKFVEANVSNLLSTLGGISPTEILCFKDILEKKIQINREYLPFSEYISGPYLVTPLSSDFFQNDLPIQSCQKNSKKSLNSSGSIISSTAIQKYLNFVYVGSPPAISTPLALYDKHVIIDRPTSSHLELLKSAARCAITGSVFHCLDFTFLSSGKKMLQRDLQFPVYDVTELENRHSCLQTLISKPLLSLEIRSKLEFLKENPSLESLCTKLQSATLSVKNVHEFLEWFEFMTFFSERFLEFPILRTEFSEFSGFEEIISLIKKYFQFEDLEKPCIRPGLLENYDAACDKMKLHLNAVEDFKTSFRKKYGFVRKTKYPEFVCLKPDMTAPVIEVTPAQYRNKIKSEDEELSIISTHESHVKLGHKTWNALQLDLLQESKSILNIEKEICNNVAQKLHTILTKILHSSRKISRLDVLQSHFQAVKKYNLVQPIFDVGSSRKFEVKDGFHPGLFDSSLRRGLACTLNDISFNSEKPICIVTGPNMGGKSTFLRQIGLMSVITQIGCFVPAASACLPPFKSVYTRFGSYDDLYNNQSSFMSEILELSRIFENISTDTLVLLDELGRGTSYLDGVSLFISVVKALSRRNIYSCLTTHYRNIDVLIRQALGPVSFQKIRFLRSDISLKKNTENGEVELAMNYKLQDGVAPHSFGLEVAGWSDLSLEILRDAKEIRSLLMSQILE